jgi:hypothetical protein
VSGSTQVRVVEFGAAGFGDLSRAKVFPVPFKAGSSDPGITFSGLPNDTRIRLFTVTGRLVHTLHVANGGSTLWDLKNAGGDRVASGVYLYVIEGARQKKEGKIVIIQ